MHGQLQPATERVAVDRGDHRLRVIGDVLPEPLGPAQEHLDRGPVRHVLQVRSGCKSLLVPGQHHGQHILVLGQLPEDPGQLLPDFQIERVQRVRTVDADNGDVIVFLAVARMIENDDGHG